MTRSRLNVRLVFVSAALVTTLATGTHLLHAWQMQRHARGQLERAARAEKAGEYGEAPAAQGRSAAFDPSDLSVRTRRALLLADQAKSQRARQQALAALWAVLPRRGGDLGVRLRAS